MGQIETKVTMITNTIDVLCVINIPNFISTLFTIDSCCISPMSGGTLLCRVVVVLPGRVDGLAGQTADCLCSPLYCEGTGGSSCTLGHVVDGVAVPALSHMLVVICC